MKTTHFGKIAAPRLPESHNKQQRLPASPPHWRNPLSSWTMALTAMLLLFAVGARADGSYQFVSVDAPGSIFFTGILGINNHGDIVGVQDGADGHAHGFARINNQYSLIDAPGATDTNALNITDNGDITGTFFDPAGFQHGYLLHAGQFSTIDVPGAAQINDADFEFGPGLGTAVFRMNNRGVLVGEYADPLGFSHGFASVKGYFTTLDVPGASLFPGGGSECIAINDANVIAGVYYLDTSPPGHGFIHIHGQFLTIDYPGAGGTSGTQCNGINNLGVVVGPYSDANDNIHGFIWNNGTFTPIDYPDAPDSESDGINDHGVIIGQYTDVFGITHGYIAYPK
ncbi:MAG TPA: hypothetical protein VKU00_26765 [Chthonomonadaceae bacterium]|nr:hypothetical protein [Chthonomonadaceae bacterium]